MRKFKPHSISDTALVKAILIKYVSKTNASVLDLGCETGYYASLLDLHGMTVYGVEYNRAYIMMAKHVYKVKNLILCDGEKLPFKKNSLDMIFCSGFSPFNTEHLDKKKMLGNHILNRLSPGGMFIFLWVTNLSNKRLKSGWINHSIERIEEYLNGLKYGKIVSIHTTYPQFFPFFGVYAFNKLFTRVSSLISKLLV